MYQKSLINICIVKVVKPKTTKKKPLFPPLNLKKKPLHKHKILMPARNLKQPARRPTQYDYPPLPPMPSMQECLLVYNSRVAAPSI